MAVPVISRRKFPVFDPFAGIPTWSGSAVGGQWVPAADIEEDDEAWVLDLELPGVAKEDVSVEVHGRRLTVSGERHDKERTGELHHQGRAYGEFAYAVRLGADIDADAVTASLEDGVLTLRVPKSAAAKPRKIDVG